MGSIPIHLRHFFYSRAMGPMIQRSALPTCLLLLGVASFVYGMKFRLLPVTQTIQETIEVERERDVEKQIPMPSAFPRGFNDPNMPPDPYRPTMTVIEVETYTVPEKVSRDFTKNELEAIVVQETTVGGVKRVESVGLKRTYDLVRAKDGKVSTDGPPGCPT